ncbi:MAG: HU family DNA-binding protein [Ruminococcus sp.]|nr:HU family DNA-binding protein [Ruminococcus sp.]MBR2304290.1 HU family DNA-binding protein [Ruminococcus sp.]
MTKAELISAIAAKGEYSKKDAEKALAAVTDSITEALAAGEKISLVGFGTFSVKDRAAKTSINPRTKEKIDVPAKKVPAFKAGKAFKDAVNK